MTYGNYPDLSKVSKILIVKLRHLGDVLLTTPLFTSLKKALPHAQIDAYVYSESIPILEGHPALHQIIGYDRKIKKTSWIRRLRYEYDLLQKIRKERYDLVINLTEGDRGAFLAKISKANIRVGFSPKKKMQKKFYTHLIHTSPSLRHMVERNLDALRVIGIFPDLEQRELYFHIPNDATSKVYELIGKESFVLIHPTSRWRFKCWPISKMRALISQILESGKKVVMTSGPDPIEIAMVQQIAEGLDIENLAGKTSLKELGALIVQSELLVCVDSVAFHLASALKKRVVVLFGPTSDITWGPWRNPHATVIAQDFSCRPCYQDGCAKSKYSDCLHTLSVEKVIKDGNVLQNRCFWPLHVIKAHPHCRSKELSLPESDSSDPR